MPDVASAFRKYANSRSVSDLARRVSSLAERGNLTRSTLASACSEVGRDITEVKDDLADLLLYYVRLALADDDLTEGETTTIRNLKRMFQIEEGDLLARRGEEVAELVGTEIRRILTDHRVDHAEAVQKVRLQEALGLSYDEFVDLSKPLVEQVVAELFEVASETEGADIHWLHQRISALDTVYRLDEFLDRQVAGVMEEIGGAQRALEAASRRAEVPARAITQEVKDMVWRRDQGRCTECSSNARLEFDHIIPFSRGGSNTYRNIQLLCEVCNRRKSAAIG